MSGLHSNRVGHGRHDRLIKERNHDPYKSTHKLHDPTTCPECGAVFAKGRWQWLADIPADAQQQYCPACQRIHEHMPAGILTLSGDFFDEHHEEIMHLMHNRIKMQNQEHPLKRLMSIEHQDDGSAVLSFTDTHSPRDVGDALAHAYQGSLDVHYAEDEDLTRVYWKR